MSAAQIHFPPSLYQQLYASSPLGIALSRVSDAVFCEANATFCDLIGYTREEVIGHSAHELQHWNNAQEREYLLSRLNQRQEVSDLVVEIRRKSGEVIKAEIAFSFIEIAGETYLLGFMTDRRDLEIALLERQNAEESLTLAKIATGVGTWTWDPISNHISWSAELERMYGLPPGGFDGTYADFAHRIHPDDLLLVEQRTAEAIAKHSRFDFDFRIIQPDGGVRWLYTLGNAEYHDDGRLLKSSGINIDITDRKQQEKDRQLMAEVMANMAEGVVLVSATSGEIVYANAKFDEILGYGPGELAGRNVATINSFTEEDPAEVAHRIISDLKRSGTWLGEVKNRRKDGRDIWCRSSVSTLEHPDYGTVWVGVHSDITEEREAKQQRDEMHEAVRKLSDHIQDAIEAERRTLARDIHDQLGAMVTGIRLRLEAIARRLPSGTEDAAKTEILAIAKLASDIQQSTREICTRLRPSILDDLGLVEACRWLLRDWMESSGLTGSGDFRQLAVMPDATISIDVFRTLQELLTNVARHAGTSSVQVELSENAQGICLRVIDDGVGFDPTMSTEGFGLAGVRERASRHHGLCSIESEETGTAITVTFGGGGAK